MAPTVRYRCFLCVVALFTAVTGEAQEIVGRLPAAANLVVRIRIDALLGSPVVDQVLHEEHGRYAAADKTLKELFGFHLSDIRTAWFVATEPENAAVLLEGRFNGTDIADRLSRSPLFADISDTPLLPVSRFTDQGDGRAKLAAVLDDSRLCLGDVDAVQQIIGVWTGRSEPRSIDAGARERLESSPSQVVATLLDAPRWKGIDTAVGSLFEQIWLLGDFTTDVATTLEAETVDERAARGLDELARGLLVLAPRNPDLAEYPDLADGFSTAKVERNDRRFVLKLVATKNDLRHALYRPDN